ncbi:MAG: GAF domain-containing protein [Chloroflexi bacterium]|nr:MAG: hypothetical protein CUN54_02255 [Phototrophicales bacterium]RMF79894.1 MAG: GAF domain-containing protein [Chloroflexota bacterium]
MQRIKPDLILVSLDSTPEASLDLLRKLSSQYKDEHIPIILFSPTKLSTIDIDVLRMGVRDYLVKPVQAEQLLALIDEHLTTTRLRLENEALKTYVLRSNRQLELRLKEIDIISNVGKSVAAIRDINELLPRVVEAAVLITRAEEGRIYLLENNELMCRAEKMYGEDSATATRKLNDDAAAKQVAFSGAPLIVTPNNKTDDNALRSAAYVPLTFNGHVNGVLRVNNVSDGEYIFTEHETHLLDMLTDYVAIAIENSRNFDQLRQTKEMETAKVRGTFERFVPPSVVAQVLTESHNLALGGKRQEVSVLFADIRGFTQWSEKAPPEKVMAMLNDYLSLAAEVILAWEGTLDKFLGDGLMAIFNAPELQKDHVHRAIDAALALLQAIEEANKLNGHNLTYSIGVHVGEAVVGYLGTERAMNYTAVGDTVNLAKRLQETAKPGHILIADTVVKRLGDAIEVEPYDCITVKGRTQPTQTYRLISARSIV